MKVLFAVDGSPHSLDAVSQVGALLTPGKDAAVLFCAPPAPGKFRKVASPDVLARAKQGMVEAVFDEARARLPEALRLTAVTVASETDPRQSVTAAAEGAGAQLIVVGARGLSGFERLLLGSVSRSVVHAAKVPVWIARPRQDAHRLEYNILLACEDPEHGAAPAKSLCGLHWPAGSTCRTLTVVPSMFAGKVPDWLQKQARSPDVEEMVRNWAQEHDEELRSMRARMTTFAGELPEVCRASEPLVIEGEPTTAILAAIGQHSIDVVALGHHRQGFLASTFLGSTAEAVLNHAPCSVLVAPHAEK